MEKDVILEGIVTTADSQGQVNIAPMGPLVEASMEAFVLRPFQTSQSFRNLKISGHGVLHVVDKDRLVINEVYSYLPVYSTQCHSQTH